MTEYTEQFHRGRASRLISEILELQAENARLVSELCAARETCERLHKELHAALNDPQADRLKRATEEGGAPEEERASRHSRDLRDFGQEEY